MPTLTLVHAGQKKIAVIKEVRAITGMLLKDAKNFVDRAPIQFKSSDMVNADLTRAAVMLRSAGAKVELTDPTILDIMTAAGWARDAVDHLGEGELPEARKALRAALDLIGDYVGD